MLRKSILVSFTSIFLSGCFVSERPLITPQSADFPFRDGTRYSAPGGQSNVNVLNIENGYYVRRQTDGETQTFLLKSIGNSLYAIQEADSNPTNGENFHYGLLVINGSTAYRYLYDSACKDNYSAYVQSALVSGVSDNGNDCFVTSLDSLASIYRALYNANSQPEETLVLQ